MQLQFSEEQASLIRGIHQSMSSQLNALHAMHKDLPFIMLVLLIENEGIANKTSHELRELCGSISMPDQERAT